MHGWSGNLLDIDLGTGAVRTLALDREVLREFLGGRGLGARLLWDLVGPQVDPLCAANVLIFATGPLTATGAPTTNRFSVSTRSPLTETILDANSGGQWGVFLKRAGYDALVVRGQAARPAWIEIAGEEVRLHDAAELWGQTVSATTAALEGGAPRRSVLCIGPAGENRVRLAAIMNDGTRALGRGGAGAVMGSKRLKAITVSGSRRNVPADPERFRFLVYEIGKMLRANPMTSQALPEFGTNVLMNVVNVIGALPVRNFQESQFAAAERLSGEWLAEHILVGRKACWACPIACTRQTRTARAAGEGPEYETVWAFGPQCGIDDLETIAEANYLCNDLGLDTISAGSTIACAMELTERGLLAGDLRFGRADILLGMLEAMAHRRGLGDELAEGSRRLAAAHGAPELSMSVKGLEMPAYDPRGMQGQGLLYATSNRGACHMRGNMLGPEVLALPRLLDRFAVQGKAGIVAIHQNEAAAFDCLVVCRFLEMAVGAEHLARLCNAVTGAALQADDLMRVGERVWNLERLYNLRAGFTAADDTLPRRLLEEPVRAGPSAGHTVHLAPMLEEYYEFRGWDPAGVPGPAQIEKLGLAPLVAAADGAPQPAQSPQTALPKERR